VVSGLEKMSRSRLYQSVLFLSLAGFIWVILSLYNVNLVFFGCPFYKITGFPCPACGSTRSVNAFLLGDYGKAFSINPLGLLTSLLMIISCIWICRDYLLHSSSYYTVYRKAEQFIRKPGVASVFIILLLANWLWNITKQL